MKQLALTYFVIPLQYNIVRYLSFLQQSALTYFVIPLQYNIVRYLSFLQPLRRYLRALSLKEEKMSLIYIIVIILTLMFVFLMKIYKIF